MSISWRVNVRSIVKGMTSSHAIHHAPASAVGLPSDSSASTPAGGLVTR